MKDFLEDRGLFLFYTFSQSLSHSCLNICSFSITSFLICLSILPTSMFPFYSQLKPSTFVSPLLLYLLFLLCYKYGQKILVPIPIQKTFVYSSYSPQHFEGKITFNFRDSLIQRNIDFINFR